MKIKKKIKTRNKRNNILFTIKKVSSFFTVKPLLSVRCRFDRTQVWDRVVKHCIKTLNSYE